MIMYSDSTAGISLDASLDIEQETTEYTVRYGNGTTKHSNFKTAARHLKVCIAQAEAIAALDPEEEQ